MRLEFFRGAFEPRAAVSQSIVIDDDEEDEEIVIRRPRNKRAKASSPPKKVPVVVQVPLPEDMSHVKEHLAHSSWKGSWSSRALPKVSSALPEWASDAVLYAGCSLTFDLPGDMELDPDDVQEGHIIIWKEKSRPLSLLGIHKGMPWLHFDAQEERLPTVLSALTDSLQAQLCFLQGTLSPSSIDSTKGELTLHVYLTSKVLAGGAFEPIARLVHLVESWDLVLPTTDWAQEQDYLFMVPDMYPPAAQNVHIQPAALQAKLLPYQKRAIAWMMEREHVEFVNEESSALKRMSEFESIYHKPVTMADGNTYHIDPLTGFLLPNDPEHKVMGGVLADEMGLGKTVMMMSLILLHPCSYTSYPSLEEFETYRYTAADYIPLPTPLTPSAATLIVTPATILYQWITEIKRHAPRLRYHVYTYKQRFDEITDLSDYDVVLTTYTDLNHELNVAEPPPNRSRRQKLQYERRMSILASILWWRVIVDEAQMVESSACKATKMARKIPRVHAWGVTGTPFRTNGLADLRDLFRFVDIHCAFANLETWNQLTMNRPMMDRVLKRLLHRNTKDMIGDEISLPPQEDTTIHLKFTGIEHHYYEEVMSKCAEDIRRRTEERATELALGKAPTGLSGPMRSWLLQLRQICDHPQVGIHNRMILGGRLRTMHQVMKLMHRTSVTRCYSLERSIQLNRIYVGQLLEMENRPVEAMNLYFQILSEIRRSLKQIVEEFDEAQALRTEKEKRRALELQDAHEHEGPSSSVSDKDENDEDILEHITIIRNRKSLWKELEHRVLFLIAGTYHDQAFPEGEDGERAKEPVDQQLVASEDMYYKWAGNLRSELLIEERSHVDELTTKLLQLGDDIAEDVRGGPRASFNIYIPATKLKGGILTALIFEKLRKLGDKLNGQWNILDTWRYTIMESVTKPLEDTNDASDKPQGDEFQGGLQNQEDSLIYLDAYSELLLDRKALLNGERVRVVHHHKKAKKPLEATLEAECKEFSFGDSANCLRAIINELRSQHNRYRVNDIELGICDAALKECTGHFDLQMKILQKLEQEKKQINDLFNARVTYYGQLQVFSDGVNIPPEPEEGFEVERQELKILREQLEMDLRAEVGKKKYMGHLLENQREEQDDSAVRECGICTLGIAEGVFAPCGHHFCKDCLEAWLVLRHACPLCKRRTQSEELIPFSKKAQELVQRERRKANEHKEFLEVLLAVDIAGSFGTKLDTVIRHILHLKSEDPQIKILVFSQWEQVLEILRGGLEENEISTIKIDNSEKNRGQAAVQFLEDPDLTVFMLNARSQSAGLTLVSATHVFIIEPVTSGLDKQAINRVHRIGQNKATHVWRYVMEATVEEKMAQLLSDAASSGTSELAWIDEKTSKKSKAKKDERKVSESCLRWCLGLIPSSANQAVSRENANPEDICDGLSDDDEDEGRSFIVELESEDDEPSVSGSSQVTLLDEKF